MALQKTVTTVHGLDAADAYHRVEAIAIEGKNTILFHVRSYTVINKPFFAEELKTAPYDIEGYNPIKQAYEYLKTLPEFADAVDC